MTACTRSRAPILARTRPTCFFTVDSVRVKRRAISVFRGALPDRLGRLPADFEHRNETLKGREENGEPA
jgi:hypothetical protein